MNGYKKWSLQIPKRKAREEDNPTEGPTAKTQLVCIPNVSGLSEQLQWLFRFHGVPSYHKPFTTLGSLLESPKDKSKKEKQFGVVYSVTCSGCNQEYIGERARILGIRF